MYTLFQGRQDKKITTLVLFGNEQETTKRVNQEKPDFLILNATESNDQTYQAT